MIIPNIPNPLTDSDYHDLIHAINPMQYDKSYGIDVYSSACNFVAETLIAVNIQSLAMTGRC